MVKLEISRKLLIIYIHTYIRTYVHTYIRTYVHTYIRTYVHTYIRTYVHTYIRTYIHTYIHFICYQINITIVTCPRIINLVLMNENLTRTRLFRIPRYFEPIYYRLFRTLFIASHFSFPLRIRTSGIQLYLIHLSML